MGDFYCMHFARPFVVWVESHVPDEHASLSIIISSLCLNVQRDIVSVKINHSHTIVLLAHPSNEYLSKPF